MSSDAGIWLADAARAFAVLRPADDAARQTIARLLGLALPSPVPVPPLEPPSDRTQIRPSAEAGLAVGTSAAEYEEAGSSQQLDSLPLLAPVSTEQPGAADWQRVASMPL